MQRLPGLNNYTIRFIVVLTHILLLCSVVDLTVLGGGVVGVLVVVCFVEWFLVEDDEEFMFFLFFLNFFCQKPLSFGRN